MERMTGAPFVHDIMEEGMLFGATIHPANMYSKLLKLDVDSLSGRPGVVKIVQDGSFVGVLATSQRFALEAQNGQGQILNGKRILRKSKTQFLIWSHKVVILK